MKKTTRAFIVKIIVDESEDLNAIADEMEEELSFTFDVDSVDFWAGPGESQELQTPIF